MKGIRMAIVSVAIVCLNVAADKESKTMLGTVISVADGDTLTVLDSTNTKQTVRLAGIDAPDLPQNYGDTVKRDLSGKVFGKNVKVLWREKDEEGHILGHLFVDGRWINKEMLADGLAWHYKEKNKNKELAEAEAAAKAGKKGLWKSAKQVPPWEFRKAEKGRANPSTP